METLNLQKMLSTTHLIQMTNEQWDIVDAHAEWFSKEESDGTSLYNFWEATGGVGSLNIGY